MSWPCCLLCLCCVYYRQWSRDPQLCVWTLGTVFKQPDWQKVWSCNGRLCTLDLQQNIMSKWYWTRIKSTERNQEEKSIKYFMIWLIFISHLHFSRDIKHKTWWLMVNHINRCGLHGCQTINLPLSFPISRIFYPSWRWIMKIYLNS